MFQPLLYAFRNAQVRTIMLIFLAMGIVFGSWAAYIPFLKERFSLDEAEMGLLLLCLPLGAIAMNPISVPLLHYIGEKQMIRSCLVGSALGFLGVFGSPYLWVTYIALFITGLVYCALNMAINTASVSIENASKRYILSSCHGFWSLGAMLGSAMASVAISFGFGPFQHFMMVAVIQICVIILSNKRMGEMAVDAAHATNEKPKLRWPDSVLWLLIVISLSVYLLEGTMADWSSIYMTTVLGAAPNIAGIGFSAYALFMATGRFFGDYLQEKLGSIRLLSYCAFLGVAGICIVILSTSPKVAIIGMAIIGAGVSLGAPILYASSARLKGYGKGVGLATLNSFAMFSFLGGPALIGFVASLTSLRIAFGFVAFTCLIWLYVSFTSRSRLTAATAIV